MTVLGRRLLVLVAAAAIVAAALALRPHAAPAGYALHRLVTDGGDPTLVNAWGLTASPTGPWWTANEARDTSGLYAADGRKQALTVRVDGGPTGIAYVGGGGFPVAAAGRRGPARFVYATEDGKLRAWSPTVPSGWSRRAEVVVDRGGSAVVFRGLTVAQTPRGARLYATDFHNGHVEVYDARWRRVRTAGFRDDAVPPWYTPFGIQAIGDRIFVTYARPAPVNGNDSPAGGYVDEFTLDGRLVAHVGRMGPLDEPWGLAQAPHGFGPASGALLVGNFGSGRIDVYRRTGDGWSFGGQLLRRDGRPLAVTGLWALRFGNGGLAGPRSTLFFTAGPHRWYGASELSVHGLLGSISAA